MLNIDWGLLQLQYELFGATEEELAEEYDTTTRMIKYAAEERNWKRAPLALACQDYSQLDTVENISDTLLDEVQKRMVVMRSLKQSALGPRYIALETALLGKCQDMLKQLQPDDPNNATLLRTVAEVFKSLSERNYGKAKEAEEQTKGLTINIKNKIDSTEESNKHVTVEVDGTAVAPPELSTRAGA